MSREGLPIVFLVVLIFATSGVRGACKSSCVPYTEGAKGALDRATYEYREQTFQCLFEKADKGKKGAVTYEDYSAWKSKHLPWKYSLVAAWTAVTFMCNCDCDKDSITWEDIHGTSSSCLADAKSIDFAYELLCKKK